MTTLLVDWLGRGGIAQCTEAWARELGAHGRDTVIVTRSGRELAAADLVTVGANGRGRLGAHRAVVASAAREVRARRPAWVVVQNYVVPALERPVYRAARDVGARVAIVVHDDRLHTWRAGTHVGLTGELRRADEVIAHSHHVADRVQDRIGRPVRVIEHPIQVGMLQTPPIEPDLDAGDAFLAAHFGVLRRHYKGTTVVEQLVGRVPRWNVIALGVGAPAARPGLGSVPGWVASGALVGAVARSDAVLLPYHHATQSGAVVLGQVLGAVPVVSAVGGIPEQVTDGVDGILVHAGAGVDAWSVALERLSDDEYRKELIVAGRERVWSAHERFARAVVEMVR